MSSKKTTVFFLFLVTLITFLFFFSTIFYKVKLFDEIVPFKETYLPACFSFGELVELISLLGLHQHFEATNTLYSNIISLRCNPFGNLLQLLIQFIFKKNPVYYHTYSLILHLINSGIVFLLIKRVSERFKVSIENKKALTIVSLLTLFWSLHPTNIESVLLLSNANIILSYTLCLTALFIFLKPEASSSTLRFSPLKSFIIFLLYLGAQFTAEFHFMVPFILIGYLTVIEIWLNHKPITESLKRSFINTMPFIIAMVIFVLFFTLSNTGTNIKKQESILLILERVFWLSPQVLFHFIKLFFFPLKLSVDQSLFVKLGKSLFSPYAIFCFGFMLIASILSLISLARANKRFPFFFIIFFLSLLSLIPFSQIPAPLYNLASERYLYFPSFMFVFGFSHYLFNLLNKTSNKVFVFCVCSLMSITMIYATRAFIRTLDWKDSFTLYYSAIKTTNNPLNKAFRYKGLTPPNKIHVQYPEEGVDKKYLKLAIKNLKQAIEILKVEKDLYQNRTPHIVKVYGLDPGSCLAKAGYYLTQTDFRLNNNYKRALQLITPYTNDLSKLDSAGLSFYGAILYFNGMQDKSEQILRQALKIAPYSTQIIFPLCDLIQIRYNNLNEIEKLSLKAFSYFPYDSFTLLALCKLYRLKGDIEKFAFFSYVYGLRHHESNALLESEKAYLFLNKKDMAKKAKERREFIERYLRKKLLKNGH